MASNMGEIDSKLLVLLTCGYCKKQFKDPRILPCTHTYCSSCLLDMKKNQLRFLCLECMSEIPPNIQNIDKNQKVNQLLMVQEDEGPEVDPELENWFTDENCPKAISNALIRKGYWNLGIVLEMSEFDVSQLGLLPGLEKTLISMISNSKRQDMLTRSSTTHRHSPTSRSRRASSSHSEYDGDERLPQSWCKVERFYDRRVLELGSQPIDSLKFLILFGRNEREEIVKLVKEQGHAIKEDQDLTSEKKSECFGKLAVVLCDFGAYDDGVDYATFADSFANSNKKDNAKFLLVYAMYRKIAEDNWGQNVDRQPLHKNLVELCDEIIKNQRDMPVLKLCKVHIQKALTLNRLYELDKCCANATFLRSAKVSLKAAFGLCKKYDLKGLLAETYYCNGCVQLNLKGREKGRHFLLLARQLCNQEFGEFSILSFRIYHILGKTFQGRSEDKLKEYECSRRSWLIRKYTKGANHPDTLNYGTWLKETFQQMAEENGDAIPGTESDHSEEDKNYSKRLEFLDQLMQQNQSGKRSSMKNQSCKIGIGNWFRRQCWS